MPPTSNGILSCTGRGVSELRVVEVNVAAVVAHDLAREQAGHDLDRLGKPGHPLGRRGVAAAGHGPLGRGVAGAETQDEAPVREHVDRRGFAGDGQRIPNAAVEHVCTDPERGGRECQRGEGGKGGGGHAEMVGDVDRLEPGVLGAPGEVGEGSGIGSQAGLQPEADRRSSHASDRIARSSTLVQGATAAW